MRWNGKWKEPLLEIIHSDLVLRVSLLLTSKKKLKNRNHEQEKRPIIGWEVQWSNTLTLEQSLIRNCWQETMKLQAVESRMNTLEHNL